MPLTKLVLTNAQSHKKRTIRFDPHVTTIVGDNDGGKSAVMRLLRFLSLNQGEAKAFVRWGKDKMTAVLELDGHAVKRVYGRGGKLNAYYLDGKRYVSFGRGKGKARMPAEVHNLINCSEVNFRHQIDGTMFWLLDTPGQVSRKLNEIVNLEVIDKSLAEAAARTRKAKTRIDVSAERVASLKSQLKSLSAVPGIGRALARLRAKRQAARKARKAARLLRQSVRVGKTLRKRKDAIRRVIMQGERVIAAGELARKAVQRRVELQRSIDREKEILDVIESGPLDLTAVLKAKAKADKAAERRRALEQSIEDELKLEDEICRLRSEIETLSQERKRLSRKGICPTCGQKIVRDGSSSQTSTSGSTPHSAGRKKETDGCPF